MKNQNLLDLVYKLILGDELGELHSQPKWSRVNYIKQFPTLFDMCLGCNKVMWGGLTFCPYCDSYHFEHISEEFVNSLNENSEEINYFVMEK